MTDNTVQSPSFRPRLPGRLIETITGLGVPFRIAGINHPIVRLDIKGIRWMKTDPRARLHRMIGRCIRWTIIIVLVMLIMDLLTMVNRLNSYPANIYYGGNFPSGYIILGASLLSLLMFFVGDFYYLLRSLKAITPERESGHWDMMRLIPMAQKEILDAKYAAVQLQSWRVLTLEYLPRLYILFSFVPNLMTTFIYMDIRYSIPYSGYSYNYPLFSWQMVLGIVTILPGFLFFVLEAGWRMRALTAIGLAISSRSRNLMTNFIVGFFTLLSVHIVELIGLFVPFHLLNNKAYQSGDSNGISYLRMYLLLTLMIAITGLLNFVILRTFQRIAYNYALRRAFREI